MPRPAIRRTGPLGEAHPTLLHRAPQDLPEPAGLVSEGSETKRPLLRLRQMLTRQRVERVHVIRQEDFHHWNLELREVQPLGEERQVARLEVRLPEHAQIRHREAHERRAGAVLVHDHHPAALRLGGGLG